MQYYKILLGTNQQYFNSTSFLSRGHLTPDADFELTTAQFATYFYVNVVPQFQTINGGNWIRVENLARDLAAAAKTNLYIYTGVYGQLELENSYGVATPLWLESSEKILVPNIFLTIYLLKLILYKSSSNFNFNFI